MSIMLLQSNRSFEALVGQSCEAWLGIDSICFLALMLHAHVQRNSVTSSIWSLFLTLVLDICLLGIAKVGFQFT